MSGFVTVARVQDVAPGSGKTVRVGDKSVAVFNVGGEFYALEGVCLHRGGPVGEGDVEDGVVTCPWHGWQYDVRTGRNVFDEEVGLPTYEVRVEGDEVKVRVGAA